MLDTDFLVAVADTEQNVNETLSCITVNDFFETSFAWDFHTHDFCFSTFFHEDDETNFPDTSTVRRFLNCCAQSGEKTCDTR